MDLKTRCKKLLFIEFQEIIMHLSYVICNCYEHFTIYSFKCQDLKKRTSVYLYLHMLRKIHHVKFKLLMFILRFKNAMLVLREERTAKDTFGPGRHRLRDGMSIPKRRRSLHHRDRNEDGPGLQHHSDWRCLLSQILHVPLF